jgi:hypothetical protein
MQIRQRQLHSQALRSTLLRWNKLLTQRKRLRRWKPTLHKRKQKFRPRKRRQWTQRLNKSLLPLSTQPRLLKVPQKSHRKQMHKLRLKPK